MTTWAMLRVQNESRWIARVLSSIKPVCKEIVVFDDHSTDDTAGICETEGCHVVPSPFAGFDEARDKNFLLAQLWSHGAKLNDWVFAIDGDELLNPADLAQFQRAVGGQPRIYAPQIVYLWDQEDQIRCDRIYQPYYRASLFPLTNNRNLFYPTTSIKGNLHCGNVPAGVNCVLERTSIRLLHFGYLHREDRLRKFAWYNSLDPNNVYEDCYRHMVIGDLPELPPSSKLKWAGPLELQPSPFTF